MFHPAVCFLLVSLCLGLSAGALVPLTILRGGEGSGSVISVSPDVVKCGEITSAGPGPADCKIMIGPNIEIGLRATPHSGSVFVGWVTPSGINCTGTNPFCRVRIGTTELNITANFRPDENPSIFVQRMSPKPGSVLPVTSPSVFIYFNGPIIFLSLNIHCTDGHNRRVIPVPVDNPIETATVGNVVWRIDFPKDDPVSLGATCYIDIPRRNALVPKDKESIYGKARFQQQELYIFDPDATLAVNYNAFYSIVDPPFALNSTVNEPVRAELLPNAVLTTAQTVSVMGSYFAVFPPPSTLTQSSGLTINTCAVTVRVIASGIDLVMAVGFPAPATGTGVNASVIVNFEQQTKYIAGRGDDNVRKLYGFAELDPNTEPQSCYFIAKEVRLAKRNIRAAVNTEDSTILIGPVSQILIPQLAAISPSPLVTAIPSTIPPSAAATPSVSFSPSPSAILDFNACSAGCCCSMTTANARCLEEGLVAATFPGCGNPCVLPSPSPSPTVSVSSSVSGAAKKRSLEELQVFPSGAVRGLLDIYTGINDLISGTRACVTTSNTVDDTTGLPLNWVFAGKRITITFVDNADQPTRRFSTVAVGLDHRTLLLGGPAELAANYALFAQRSSTSRGWERVPFSIDASGRLTWNYNDIYEDFIFVRTRVVPTPIPSVQSGGTSGGSTTLFADLTETNDPTYGPVSPDSAYVGNFVPTPVPLVDNPFFTDRTFRLSAASVSFPSVLLLAATAFFALLV